MGVMKCDRKGCESIGCRTYIKDVGYICDECIEEFKRELVDSGHDANCVARHAYFLDKLVMFMKTERDYVGHTIVTVEGFFNYYKPKQL